MSRHAGPIVWVVAVLALLLAAPAAAQVIGPVPPSAARMPEPGLQPPLQAPFTITPSLTVSEEYNDNILLDNRNKRWDFITSFEPRLALAADSTRYHLIAAYSFRADVYARDESRTDAFARQSFLLESSYRLTPALTLTLSDIFFLSNDTNLVAQESVATGRTRSHSNTVTPGVTYQLDPRNTLRGFASYTILRYDSNSLLDSDTYRVQANFDHAFSRRLTGTVGYQFAYFDVKELGTSTVHTPLLGATYRFTETLTAAVSGGPSFVHQDSSDRDSVTPAVAASLVQRLSFGSIALVYDQGVGTAGGLGGVTDNKAVAAIFRVDTLVRGLTFELAPRYNIVESIGDDSIDVHSFSLPLRVTYRINRYLTALAGYQFFRQRSFGAQQNVVGTSLANDVDQNRVAIGLQIGYPITLE